MTTPRFAIVGHPNKGKSSIVATLAEDDSVQISPHPGTTTRSRVFPMRLDGTTLYELIDTPGFQRAREALAWLSSHERGAESRPDVLAEFVAAHRTDPRFAHECALLAPIVEGAGILYVVDGSRPYGREYEPEMDVLRWSGRPRMALINLIGERDHVAAWRTALDQYFAIVRVFDALEADFERRIALLRSFGELSEAWRPQLAAAADALVRERQRRRARAADEIARMLSDSLTATVRARVADEHADDHRIARLGESLKETIRKREREARRAVQDLYRHGHAARRETELGLLDADAFSERSFSVFGLSGTQLALTAAASGAAAFGGVDVLLGGSTLGLAAALGAVVGGAGALLGAREIAKVSVLGKRVGGYELVVGPLRAPNVAWVLLGRALLHHRLVSERNHAQREAIVLDVERGAHLADRIDVTCRRALERCFERLRSTREADAETTRMLAREIDGLLRSQGAASA